MTTVPAVVVLALVGCSLIFATLGAFAGVEYVRGWLVERLAQALFADACREGRADPDTGRPACYRDRAEEMVGSVVRGLPVAMADPGSPDGAPVAARLARLVVRSAPARTEAVKGAPHDRGAESTQRADYAEHHLDRPDSCVRGVRP